MKKSLTSDEMLNLWRNLRIAEPPRLDCAVERVDGPDFTQWLETQMRAWYLDLLDHGDLNHVCPTDVSYNAIVKGTDLKHIEVSAATRRIISVEYSEWGAPVPVNATEARVRAAAANPYIRRPLVAAIGPYTLLVAGARGTLKAINAIVDPGPGLYLLDDSALSLISN